MKKRVLSLFLAITLCLTLTPTGALAAEGQPPEQMVTATQEAQIPAPALEEKEEEKTTPAQTGAGENAPPANPEENPTEDAPAAAEKNTVDKEAGKEAGQNEPTVEGENEPLALGLDDAEQNAAGGENGEAGGTSISEEDTRTVIWRDTQWTTKISRPYDGTTDGSTVPLSLTFTDGTNEIRLKEGTDFTAVKTFDSAEVGDHTVTVEITLSGEAAAKYKLREAEERFTIDGTIDPAAQNLTLSLSKTTCAVGEKLLPLLSLSGVKEDAAVTYYYTQYKTIAGDSEYEGSEAIPKIDENTVIDKLDEEGNNTYYVYAKTAATKNYNEGISDIVELTVSNDVASVTTSSGVTNNYTSLDAALNAAQDGDTVTLLSDAEITRWHSLSKAFTLELNGKTATTQSKAELYLHARVIVQDSSTGKTGGMAGTALLNVQEGGDLIIQSGTFNGRITINDGKLTINGGTFNQEVGLPRGDSDSVFFSGGTFAKIWYPNSSGSFLDLLADGYAFFYTKDSNLVNAAEISGTFLYNVQVQQHTHSFTDGACACGYTCPHTSVDASGTCAGCHKQFAASVTVSDAVTYYDTFSNALVYATQNDGCTLKLLTDVTGMAVMINNPFIFDLNGHNVDQGLSTNAKATIKDSGTTKGRIGKVTVSNEKVTDLTLGSLLEEGYAFKYGNGYWANDSYLQTTEGSFVTVEKAPIQSVNVYAKDKNNQEILTIAYGATGEVTLVSSCKLSETSGENLSCAWYKLTDDTAIPPLDGATGTSYTLPADLPAGKHTYWVTFTSDGYSKSAEITVTVTPVSLVGAEVTVQSPTYNGKLQEPKVTVKLGDKTLSRDNDYSVQVTKQTDAGSYKLTIKGGGNYTDEIEDVEWKIEPLPISLPSVSSISKTYDGSADVTLTADKLTFRSITASRQDITLPDTALSFTNAQFTKKQADGSYLPSPEVGGGKALSFTMTLTSNNYVFEGKSEGTTEVSDVFATDDANRFTITKAAAPTNIQTGTLNVINGTKLEYTYDAKQLLPAAPKGTYGTVFYAGEPSSDFETGYTVDSCKVGINSGVLTLTIDAQNGEKTGKIGSVTIYVTTDNYETISMPIDLYAVNKITPVADGNITASNITYSDELSKSTISGKMKNPTTGDEVKGTFAWTDGTIKPDANDNYEAEWTFTPDAPEYATVTGKTTVKVAPKSIEGAKVTLEADSFVYDGNKKTPVVKSVVLDNVTLTSLTDYGYIVVKMSNVGIYNFTITGDGNYTGEVKATWQITAREVTPAIEVASCSYTGDALEPNVTVKDDLGNTIDPKEYEIFFSNNTNAGTGRVTIKDVAGGNYVIKEKTQDFTITKAAAPTNIQSGTLNIINGTKQTYTYDFSKLLPELSEGQYGTVSYGNQPAISLVSQSGYYYDQTIVEFKKGVLTLAQFYAKDGTMTGQIGTVNVTVTTTNYEDFQLTLVLNAINKPTPDDKITASDITYGQALSASTITGTMKDPTTGKEITGTFTWTDGTVKPNAGSHNAEWIFTPDESYGGKYTTYTDTATVKVNPKAVTVSGITAKDKVYDGNTDAVLDYSKVTLNGVLENDTLTVTVTGTFESANAGKQKVKISGFKLGGNSVANYVLAESGNQTETTATITVREATVTPDNKTKVYEEKDPDLTYAVSGVLDGETLKGITLTRAEGENAGEYAITATADAGANPNYDVTFAKGKFTINPKSIDGATVKLGKGLTANGAEQTQTVEKVLLDGKELPADSYTVAGNTATAPGSHTLTITAKGNYTGTVKQTYVIAPAKAEDAPGAEIVIDSGKVKVVVKSEGAVPPATLLTDKAELLAMLVDSGDITADELAQIADGAIMDIVLTVKEANVHDEVKTAMAQAAKGYTIGQYLDISLFKYMTVNGKQQDGVALRTTKNALTISVAVPDALINTNSAVNRTYCIVRRHDGAITVLDAAFDAASKTLTFKTDRFSDYAIAYKDTAVPSSGSNPSSNNSSNGSETKKNEVAAPTPAPASTSKPSTITAMPQTGDTSNPTLYVVLLVASLLGLAVVFVCKKRNDK